MALLFAAQEHVILDIKPELPGLVEARGHIYAEWHIQLIRFALIPGMSGGSEHARGIIVQIAVPQAEIRRQC